MSARASRRGRTLLILAALTALTAGVAAVLVIERVGAAPREWARYIAHRVEGHNAAIVGAGNLAAHWLLRAERSGGLPIVIPGIGADPERPRMPAHAVREVLVDTPPRLIEALADARPGDYIELLPGTYRVAAARLVASRAGRADAPVRVTAAKLGTVRVELDSVEGFVVEAPYWQFENLEIHGVCRQDTQCEHAFHIVGRAHHFSLRNSVLRDFNAALKINGERGAFPDAGRIEFSTLENTRARDTGRPVTPIDMVAASDWTVRANFIGDFIKAGGDGISYGAFAKGGGERNRFEGNVVVCENRLQGQSGQRIGLSLGGGGTALQACRDGRCVVEHQDGVLHNNLVMRCSDRGIYLNGAGNSTVSHNTLLDTAGLSVRYPNSTANLFGNLIDGGIQARDGGVVRDQDNHSAWLWQSFVAWRPVRGLLADVAAGDLRWRVDAVRMQQVGAGLDMCGSVRGPRPAYGAFETISGCVRPRQMPQ